MFCIHLLPIPTSDPLLRVLIPFCCNDKHWPKNNAKKILGQERVYFILQVGSSSRGVGAGNQAGTWIRSLGGSCLLAWLQSHALDSLPFSSDYGGVIHPACAKGPISYLYHFTSSSLPVPHPRYPHRVIPISTYNINFTVKNWNFSLGPTHLSPGPFPFLHGNPDSSQGDSSRSLWTHDSWAFSCRTAQTNSFPPAGVLTLLDLWTLEIVVLPSPSLSSLVS